MEHIARATTHQRTSQNAQVHLRRRAGNRLGSAYQQCPFGFEGAELRGVAKPFSGINLRRWRGIGDSFVRDVSEARTPEKLAPFIGREKMRGDREEPAPLLAVRVVGIVVDQDPGRPALTQNADRKSVV